ncbi:hypothetical protein MRX96_051633 [Rhipicephalus microplus]
MPTLESRTSIRLGAFYNTIRAMRATGPTPHASGGEGAAVADLGVGGCTHSQEADAPPRRRLLAGCACGGRLGEMGYGFLIEEGGHTHMANIDFLC